MADFNTYGSQQVDYSGATVSVPLPAAFWLLGCASIMLLTGAGQVKSET